MMSNYLPTVLAVLALSAGLGKAAPVNSTTETASVSLGDCTFPTSTLTFTGSDGIPTASFASMGTDGVATALPTSIGADGTMTAFTAVPTGSMTVSGSGAAPTGGASGNVTFAGSCTLPSFSGNFTMDGGNTTVSSDNSTSF